MRKNVASPGSMEFWSVYVLEDEKSLVASGLEQKVL